MGTDKVKEYLANFGLADRVMEFKESSISLMAVTENGSWLRARTHWQNDGL